MGMRKAPAFTFMELMMVIGIFAVIVSILGVITFNAMNQRQATSEVELLLAALSFQQQRAANRVVNGGPNQDYGIYFFEGGYTQFSGSSFQEGNANNRTTNLSPGVDFGTISFPDNQIVFDEVTGFVKNYQPDKSSVVIINRAEEQSLISVNRLGVVEVSK